MATVTIGYAATAPSTPAANHAVLYVDSNGAFKAINAAGTNYALINTLTEASSTVQTSTTSTSFGTVSGMSLVLGVGTYLVLFSMHAEATNNSSYGHIGIFQDGTIHQDSERTFHYMSGHNHTLRYSLSTQAIVEVTSGTSTITAQWKSPQGITITGYDRTLVVLAV